jgi:hypothetical protein
MILHLQLLHVSSINIRQAYNFGPPTFTHLQNWSLDFKITKFWSLSHIFGLKNGDVTFQMTSHTT